MKKTHSFLFALITLFTFSCDDILEEDITNDTIQTQSPSEGTTIEGNSVQFVWQALDGADDYRLQVLNSNQALVVDSLLTVTDFETVLNPGNYQWRIRGENFAYTTAYTFPVNFTMISSDDLTNQNVQLSTPSDDFYTNDTSIILTWSAIINAESYSLDVVKLNGGEETVLQETGITSVNYNLPSALFDEDAEYVWRVKAVNSTSESSFSERSIFLDTQAPGQPNLITPVDLEESSTSTVTFNWTNGSDTGNVQSTRSNTIEISDDINFGSLLFSEDLQNNSIPITFDSSGTYYWRVRAFDDAGNIGDYSITRTIIIE